MNRPLMRLCFAKVRHPHLIYRCGELIALLPEAERENLWLWLERLTRLRDLWLSSEPLPDGLVMLSRWLSLFR